MFGIWDNNVENYSGACSTHMQGVAPALAMPEVSSLRK